MRNKETDDDWLEPVRKLNELQDQMWQSMSIPKNMFGRMNANKNGVVYDKTALEAVILEEKIKEMEEKIKQKELRHGKISSDSMHGDYSIGNWKWDWPDYPIHTSSNTYPPPTLQKDELAHQFITQTILKIFPNRNINCRQEIENLFSGMNFDKVFDLFLQKSFASQLNGLDELSDQDVVNYIKLLL